MVKGVNSPHVYMVQGHIPFNATMTWSEMLDWALTVFVTKTNCHCVSVQGFAHIPTQVKNTFHCMII